MRLFALILVLGCQPQKAPETAEVRGTVRLVDPAPKSKPFKIACPSCAPLYPAGMPREDLVLDPENRVRGAFVYVAKGLEGTTFEAPQAPVVLEQKGCRYEPHVLGIRPGQDLLIRNRDPHRHCAQALPFKNREFIVGQDGGTENRKSFAHPEVMVKLKDSIYPWMGAWIAVVDHPFFAVTGPDGSYSIRGLTPGRYTLEVWQEKCRSMSVEFQVKATAPTTADFRLELRND